MHLAGQRVDLYARGFLGAESVHRHHEPFRAAAGDGVESAVEVGHIDMRGVETVCTESVAYVVADVCVSEVKVVEEEVAGVEVNITFE